MYTKTLQYQFDSDEECLELDAGTRYTLLADSDSFGKYFFPFAYSAPVEFALLSMYPGGYEEYFNVYIFLESIQYLELDFFLIEGFPNRRSAQLHYSGN